VTADALAVALAVAVRVLNQRLLTLLALILDAGMFSWAMGAGGWDRLAIAAVFALAAGLTIHLRGVSGQ